MNRRGSHERINWEITKDFPARAEAMRNNNPGRSMLWLYAFAILVAVFLVVTLLCWGR